MSHAQRRRWVFFRVLCACHPDRSATKISSLQESLARSGGTRGSILSHAASRRSFQTAGSSLTLKGTTPSACGASMRSCQGRYLANNQGQQQEGQPTRRTLLRQALDRLCGSMLRKGSSGSLHSAQMDFLWEQHPRSAPVGITAFEWASKRDTNYRISLDDGH
jgi:hypothetical protein